jgi:hypothetical protein
MALVTRSARNLVPASAWGRPASARLPAAYRMGEPSFPPSSAAAHRRRHPSAPCANRHSAARKTGPRSAGRYIRRRPVRRTRRARRMGHDSNRPRRDCTARSRQAASNVQTSTESFPSIVAFPLQKRQLGGRGSRRAAKNCRCIPAARPSPARPPARTAAQAARTVLTSRVPRQMTSHLPAC